jgi:four helix bundle protein
MSRAPFPDPTPNDMPTQPWLGAERLDVYRVALEFLVHATEFGRGRIGAALRDQLDRASSSIVLNVAEGAGRVSGRDKVRFYAIARGSAMECAAILDVLDRQRRINVADHTYGRQLLVRVVQMLTKLGSRFTVRPA